MHMRIVSAAALLLLLGVSAQAATGVSSLTDSSGHLLQQAINCSGFSCLQGVAYGAGYLAGCEVVLSSQNAANSTARTDSNGTFTFPVDPSTLVNGTVTIPMNQGNTSHIIVANQTVYNCSDTATNQAPPFTVTARVPSNGSAVIAVNAISTATALALGEVSTLPAIIRTILSTSGALTPDTVFTLLSEDTAGLPGLAATPYINALSNLSDATLAKYYTLNAQIFNTLALSGQRVAAVTNGTVSGAQSDIDAALQELASVLVPSLTTILGSSSNTANLSLTNAATIANTLQSAVQGFSNSSANSASQVSNEVLNGVLNTVSSLTGFLGRKLLMDESALRAVPSRQLLMDESALRAVTSRQLLQATSSTADPVSTAVGTVIAAVNSDLADLIPASGSINGTRLQQDVASLLYVAQTSIFNAVPAVSNGTQALTNFTAMYTGVNLTQSVNAALALLATKAPAVNLRV